MRPVHLLAFVVLLGIATPGTAAAARGVASATIVAPVVVSAAPASGTPSVSVAIVRDGANEHVTIAFN